jgi:acetyltransferase
MGLVQAMLRDTPTEASLTPEQLLAVQRLVCNVSELIAARPEITELHFRPVLVDARGGAAGSALLLLGATEAGATPFGHMAIQPYPAQFQWSIAVKDGTLVTVRPIRPEDAAMEAAFVKALSPSSRYFRFMMNLRELTPDLLNRFTQIDYDRELALIAIDSTSGVDTQVAVARYGMNPNQRTADFAIVVADAWQGQGLGKRLLELLMEAARSRGIEALVGEMLADNEHMRRLMLSMGFTLRASHDDVQVLLLERSLKGPPSVV